MTQGLSNDPAFSTTAQLVEDRRARLLSGVRALHLPQRPWTVVDYPMHLNCGDAALYLGEERLATALGSSIERVLDRESYRSELVRPGTLPVLPPGGNWGGLYPTHHRLRLRLLEDTRGQDVLQLPQSIEYVDEHHREELRRAVGRHGRLTLLVRDERSYELAVRDYDCPVHLLPDVAFALGPLRRSAPHVPVRTQVRTDKEGSAPTVQGEVFDWLLAPRTSRAWLTWQATMKVNRLQRRTSASAVRLATIRAAHELARVNLRRASGMLSAGEVIVTDRLHGHVLCTLLSIPHVVVNDKFGKISALRNTWTAVDTNHEFASAWEDVPEALNRLQERVRSR
ncbi:polysaccharide pyruvyl transferase family protein [Kineococcus auxinigenes]|uniref:polysaccharide pyruvyl transferase family protein n=1 Tax=unclassified Kineococcus TaxID=2621656 RepID=UPI003D7C3948